MPKYRFITAKCFCFYAAILLLVAAGCSNTDSSLEDEYLIRVGDRTVTVMDFNNAFEIAKTAYSHHINHKPDELNEAKRRLLNQMVVEMILLERAEELDIQISDQELSQAVSNIKADYPEGTFEETLVENAISYESWEKQLKSRLIMEKLIERELHQQITITSEDISQYYEENNNAARTESGREADSEEMNEAVIKYLRRQKAENAYSQWLEQLKQKVTIDINSEQWEKILVAKNLQ
jgi:hypothetical protein